MEVFFHEESDVDGGDGKEKARFIFLHDLDQFFVLSNEPYD